MATAAKVKVTLLRSLHGQLRHIGASVRGLGREVRPQELGAVTAAVIDLAALKAAQIVPVQAERAKVVLSGELKKAVHLKGIATTKGARAAIESAGGKVEE